MKRGIALNQFAQIQLNTSYFMVMIMFISKFRYFANVKSMFKKKYPVKRSEHETATIQKIYEEKNMVHK